MEKPELLAPAGGTGQLEAALRWGADAVYLGGPALGMRTTARMTLDETAKSIALAHSQGCQAHVTCNVLATNAQADEMPGYIGALADMGADAFIVADMGVFALAKSIAPNVALHVSVQMGVTNYRAAAALHELGAKRVVLARELSLRDVYTIRRKTPPTLELECFVHGAMCMSVSGRCLLSSFMAGRDANQGDCAQPCRWKYALMEQRRPGEYYPIEQPEGGSYILNAHDLCMLEYLDLLAAAGVSSLKIEGRAKSEYYTASVTGAYRAAIDSLNGAHVERAHSLIESGAQLPGERLWQAPPNAVAELEKTSHRPYSTGFYFGTPGQRLESSGYLRSYQVMAIVEGYGDGMLSVSQRNRFFPGQEMEILRPGLKPLSFTPREIIDAATMQAMECARHPMQLCLLPYAGEPPPKGSFLRTRAADE